MRRKYIIFLVVLAVVLIAVALSKTFFAKDYANVIIISVDALRADHLSCYGYHRETSPTIDKLAEEGVLFEHCIAQRGLTCPSLTSIMTSQYPMQHGIRTNGYNYGEYDLTLAVTLESRGYKTGVFTANMLNTPLLGFDTKKGRNYRDQRLKDEYITIRARRWLKEHEHKRLFAWLHYISPHIPYDPLGEYAEMFTNPDYDNKNNIDGLRPTLSKIASGEIEISQEDLDYMLGLYDGEILYTDHLIERIVETLDELGLLDKSIIVFTADHGEDLYDRNRYFGHEASIYDSSLKIPLIIRYPSQLGKSQVEQVVESIDIAPTILDLLEIPIPDSFEGKSLLPLMASSDSYPKTCAYSEIEDKIYSIRTNDYRYIFNPTNFCPPIRDVETKLYNIEEEELYNLAGDANESNNIVEEDPQVAKQLKEKLAQWLDRYGKEEKFTKTKLSKDKIRELKALGYIR